ncbi:MAG: endonuclease/exonuclease/phosphatase family protein [Anaerolineales bacterium]|nr:endonuclease/exonuclease/phosphatase family protein [Anaerolineales bacterium]
MRGHRSWRVGVWGGALALLLSLWGVRTARTVDNYADPAGPLFRGEYAEPAWPFHGELRIATWNIRYGEAVETAVAEIRQNPHLRDADVLLLQEMDETGVAAIAQRLAYNYVYFPASVHAHHGRNFGNAILARWPITRPEKLLLPYANPSNAQRRIAVKATILVDGAPLVVVSTHTETYWLGRRERIAQAAAVATAVAPGEGPVIVGGDFNSVTAGDVALLEGVFTAVGLERVSAAAGPTVEVAGMGVSADHIFARGLPVLAAGAAAETAASDHLPVWATLAWSGPQSGDGQP